jgi:TonB family protein
MPRAPADPAVDLLGTFAQEEAADRRRLRRALWVAIVAHVLLLAAPRPEPRTVPVGARRAVAVFELRTARFAPPQPPPPDPVVEEEPPELPPEPAEEAELGAPAPPPVEVLFEAGELSRLVPPRPVAVAVPPTPPGPAAAGGEVRLLLRLDEEGSVLDARRLAGDPALAEAAAWAARRWTFLPATLDGQPIPVVVEVAVRFAPGPGAAPPPPPGPATGRPSPDPTPGRPHPRSAPTASATDPRPSRSSRATRPRLSARTSVGPR